ncbi:MAG TPA: hypothetical protein VED46_10630 [Alphaproteobacteria bacterium]|nr:hypothetical protein [Alphaproteobacteria bacterium]
MIRDSRRIRWVFAALGFAVALAAAPTAEAEAQTAPAALIEGFRSAKFGADEKALRLAIKADFGLDGKSVVAQENPIEKTTTLLVNLDILEPGGRAQIAYILGYKTKKLIQVNVVWGAPADPGASVESLSGTAVTLRNYFIQQAFAADRRQQDQRLADGSLLFFQGTDAKGRQVSLHLFGAQVPGKEGDEPKSAFSLRLSYIANPQAPDIFQLKPGAF